MSSINFIRPADNLYGLWFLRVIVQVHRPSYRVRTITCAIFNVGVIIGGSITRGLSSTLIDHVENFEQRRINTCEAKSRSCRSLRYFMGCDDN